MDAVLYEKKRILKFANASSVYLRGYGTNGNLALKEMESGEEIFVKNNDFAREKPEEAFLKVEEELYPEKTIARKIARRWVKKPMYRQERLILGFQTIRKLAQPKYLEGKLNENYINLDEENETVKRIKESYGVRGLEIIQKVQNYVQEKIEKREKIFFKNIRAECFGNVPRELSPCITSARVLQEFENLRLIRKREAQLEKEKKREISKLVEEAVEAGYSGN